MAFCHHWSYQVALVLGEGQVCSFLWGQGMTKIPGSESSVSRDWALTPHLTGGNAAGRFGHLETEWI